MHKDGVTKKNQRSFLGGEGASSPLTRRQSMISMPESGSFKLGFGFHGSGQPSTQPMRPGLVCCFAWCFELKSAQIKLDIAIDSFFRPVLHGPVGFSCSRCRCLEWLGQSKACLTCSRSSIGLPRAQFLAMLHGRHRSFLVLSTQRPRRWRCLQ